MTDRVSFRPRELQIEADGGIRLLGSRCPECGAHFFPVREVCARCLTELEPFRLSTEGTLYTCTVVRQSTPAFEVPYILGYVDLPEGVRLMAQLTGLDTDEVRIGMRLELVPADWGIDPEGRQLVGYKFRPKEAA
ncbi:MAG TPA: Zn-ribbon domain-containing OB-fold protein [Acidimicrobiia bacterium]|jgi:uncharacterized OB-fold protein|nr:Zn-ribbon domain-containing OB-fold protein [Acidimicrobiia bacterium]